MTHVRAAHDWPTNAAMIEEISRLRVETDNGLRGYFDGDGVDVTYGRGGFWKKFTPRSLVQHDLFVDGVDFRELPHADCSFDYVVFDPPYKLNGTPALGDTDNRYGVDVAATKEARLACIGDGLRECLRITRYGGHVLVKLQDQVVGGKVVWMTDDATRVAERRGFRKRDSIAFLGGGMKQPERTRRCKVCNGRGDYEHPASPGLSGTIECDGCDGSGRVSSPQQHAYYRGSSLLIFVREIA